jgi:hypothetical protein
MAERDLLHLILSSWGAHPQLRIWRANTGVGWFANGQPARKTDSGAYPVKFGTPGQGDVSGLVLPSGRRLEIETKFARGQQSDDQKSFQRMIERFGGLYVLARSLEDVDRALAALGVTR